MNVGLAVMQWAGGEYEKPSYCDILLHTDVVTAIIRSFVPLESSGTDRFGSITFSEGSGYTRSSYKLNLCTLDWHWVVKGFEKACA